MGCTIDAMGKSAAQLHCWGGGGGGGRGKSVTAYLVRGKGFAGELCNAAIC